MNPKTSGWLGILLVLAGCGGNDGGNNVPTIKNDEEFPPLTWDDLIDTVTKVQTENPKADKETVSKLVLDRLKERNFEVHTREATAGDLNAKEIWLLITNFWPISDTREASDDALREAQKLFPAYQLYLDRADAFRHAYWNVLLSKRIDEDWAEAFTTAHEWGTPDSQDKDMDLHNNDVGRYILRTYPNESEKQLRNRSFNYQYTKMSLACYSLDTLIYIIDNEPPPPLPPNEEDSTDESGASDESGESDSASDPDTTAPVIVPNWCGIISQATGQYRILVMFDDPGDNASGFNSAWLQLEDSSGVHHGIGGQNWTNPVVLEHNMTGWPYGLYKVITWAKDNAEQPPVHIV